MAEFGTPETWNMKVGDFIESELPKEKPQALLDLQEQNRKQRLLDALQKIGPGLMDESLDFIRRNQLAFGSRDKPKRGLVDEPGSYSGKLGQKYLYESKSGGYEVRSDRDGTYKLFSKDKLKEAKAFAKKLEEKFAKVDSVGLGTEDLAKKLGVAKNTIFTFKSRDSEVFKNIKKYFNVKQKSSTTPVRYVLKKGINLKDAIQDIKSSIGAPGGKGTKKATYGGKETTMSQVKNVLLKSKKPLNPDQIKELLPNMNIGTIRNNLQMLKNDESVANKIKRFERGAKETAAKISQTVAETNAPFMKAIRDQLVLDPDSDTEDLAKALFGDKKYNAVKGTAEQIRLDTIAERQLPKFLALFSKGAKTITPGFKNIPPDKLGDIIESLETRLDEFGSLDAGDRRRLMFSIADTKRNLPERATETATGFLKQKGKEVDEVVGVSATYNRAPGYIEATQVIDSKINQLKRREIDSPFSKEFQKVLDGDYSGYKKYNKKARAFARKYKVDTPIIKIGENLEPEKFISNFKDFTPAAQKNIKQIAKDKGVVIQTKSKPLFSIAKSSGPTLGKLNFKPGMQDDGRLVDLEGGQSKGFFGGKELAGGLLKTLQTLGTPAGVVAAELGLPGGIRSQLQEEGLEKTLRNPITYLGPVLANIGAEAVKNPTLQRFLNLGLPLKVIRAGTPVGLGLAGISALVDSALKAQEEFEAMSPEEQKQFLKEQEEFGKDVQGAAEGGIMRLGFADGPKDPSKRKFMKLMGILSLLPYGLGKLIKPAAKVAPVVAEGVKLGFDKFMMLVNKIKELGTPTSKVTQKEREVGYTYTGKDGSEYELVEDLTTGDIRVTKDKPGFTMSGDEAFDTIEDRSTFVLTKGQADETTKGKKPPDEYEEVKEVASPDGTFDDVDEISDKAVKEVLDEID